MEWKIGTIIRTNLSADYYVVLQTCIFEQVKYYLIANQKKSSEMLIIRKIDENSDDLEIIKDEEKIDSILKEMSK